MLTAKYRIAHILNQALPTPSIIEEAVWQAAWIHMAFINIHPFAVSFLI